MSRTQQPPSKRRLIDGHPLGIFTQCGHVEKYYSCHICLAVVRDPVQCKQGHLFCKMCIERAIATRPICPCDNVEPLTLASLSNNLTAKNIINDLQVVCIECDPSAMESATSKCNWKGILSEMDDHLDVCEYVTETCPYEGCNVICMRKNLGLHKRTCEFGMTICPFKGCGKRMCLDELADHKAKCHCKATLCTSGCGQMVDGLDLPQHKLKDCPNQVIPCPLPTKCKCGKPTFIRSEANSAQFPYHDHDVVNMKRDSDLFKIGPKASFSIESDADTKGYLVGTYDLIPGETAYGLPVYKKRGAEKWLQCPSKLFCWIVQTKDFRHTNAGYAHSPWFSNIYEFKLPHEMTTQWTIWSNDKWTMIDVKITTLSSA